MSLFEKAKKAMRDVSGSTARENKIAAKQILAQCTELKGELVLLETNLERRMQSAKVKFESHRQGLALRFPRYFKQLKKHAELILTSYHLETKLADQWEPSSGVIQNETSKKKNIFLETAKGAASGMVSATTLVTATATLGTASTGTAIATLAGAAQTNAVLASIGFGAKAAGGLGMVGGGAILGGIVALPALSYFLYSNHKNAEVMKTDADTYRASLQIALEKAKLTSVKITAVERRIDELVSTEAQLEKILKKSLSALTSLLKKFKESEHHFKQSESEVLNEKKRILENLRSFRKLKLDYSHLTNQINQIKWALRNDSLLLRIYSPYILKYRILRYFLPKKYAKQMKIRLRNQKHLNHKRKQIVILYEGLEKEKTVAKSEIKKSQLIRDQLLPLKRLMHSNWIVYQEHITKSALYLKYLKFMFQIAPADQDMNVIKKNADETFIKDELKL
ncbi:hypothetical protein [Leptospira levettii]|uniref:hypothetical protein n=1 Tax=Leptospira levettii TaxID=2023178 RepID=UPI003EBC156D